MCKKGICIANNALIFKKDEKSLWHCPSKPAKSQFSYINLELSIKFYVFMISQS